MNKIILPTFLILVSLGLFIFYIDPIYKNVKDLRVVNSQYGQARDKSKELRELRDGLLTNYNSFSEANLARIKKVLPDNVDNVRLVIDIDNIASKYGITIRGVKIGDSSNENGRKDIIQIKEKKNYDFVTLYFTMSSTYDNFVAFISDIKDSLRLVDIVSLDFNIPTEGSDIYKYNLGVKTYWLK